MQSRMSVVELSDRHQAPQCCVPSLGMLFYFTCSTSECGKITDTLRVIVEENAEIERISKQVAQACTEPTLKKV